MDLTPLLVVLLGASLLRVGRFQHADPADRQIFCLSGVIRCGTLGDRHPSFRAEGQVPDTYGLCQRHRKLHAIAHKIAPQWRRTNLGP